MNRLSTYIIFFGFIISAENNMLAQSGVTITDNQKIIIEARLLKPIRIIHDSAQFFKTFANAYTISSVWKYDIESSPGKKNLSYGFILREYRGAFVIDQYKFKLYEKEGKIEVEDWETGEFIDVTAWLKKYKKYKQK